MITLSKPLLIRADISLSQLVRRGIELAGGESPFGIYESSSRCVRACGIFRGHRASVRCVAPERAGRSQLR